MSMFVCLSVPHVCMGPQRQKPELQVLVSHYVSARN